MTAPKLKDIAGRSDIGLRRTINEDAVVWDAELGLAVVADGVGGSNGGEVASATAVRSIHGDLRHAVRGGQAQVSGEGRAALVQELVRRAHQRILATAARDPALAGMSATLAMTLLAEDRLIVANIGDSRVYRLRGRALERLTRDHLVATELVETGALSEEEAKRSNNRSMLTRALGMAGDVRVDLTQHELESGDVYLLCSDGLTTAIDDNEIGALMRREDTDLRQLASEAVACANRRGGRDNVSVVLMRIA